MARLLVRTTVQKSAGLHEDAQIGDVQVVKPDGWEFTDEERTIYAIVDIPGLAADRAEQLLLTPVWEGWELSSRTYAPGSGPTGDSESTAVQKKNRRFRLDKASLRAALPTAQRGRLDNAFDPTVTVRDNRAPVVDWAVARGHFKDTISGIGAPA